MPTIPTYSDISLVPYAQPGASPDKVDSIMPPELVGAACRGNLPAPSYLVYLLTRKCERPGLGLPSGYLRVPSGYHRLACRASLSVWCSAACWPRCECAKEQTKNNAIRLTAAQSMIPVERGSISRHPYTQLPSTTQGGSDRRASIHLTLCLLGVGSDQSRGWQMRCPQKSPI